MTRDGYLLFSSRIVRLFAYGFLSIIFALYLAEIGLTEIEIGALLTLTLLGDAAISFWITASADRLGRRSMLLVGSGLMLLAGLAFGLTDVFWVLIIAAIIGVISPSGNEVGPFLPIEQAALTQIIQDRQRTAILAWYNLAGSVATALGALSGGILSQAIHSAGASQLMSYRIILFIYALLGIALASIFFKLTSGIEVKNTKPSQSIIKTRLGLHRSLPIVLRLSGLFALDAFAGGLVIQSLMAYWFHVQFEVEPAILGGIFFGANALSGISALAAARISEKFGLINTMVWTHIPSNILLILIPLMPSLGWAIAILLLRFSISQMDVPTRQSYTMAVVDPDERSAAAGVTNIARSLGSSLSPSITGALFGMGLTSIPFLLAGGLKIIYDLALFFSFRSIKPPEERS
ncbi:MFS transporter [Candidatus Acetothermia bacterium]|nr:MFS transporter [Candidatus Acetothermia bacterium]MBI3643349.1 MFS transporter [Candidatus Acetothermia bacterium]